MLRLTEHVGGIGGGSLAEQYVPSGIAALIVAAIPLWVVLINAIRPGGARPTWQTTAGVIVGATGMFILIDPLKSPGQQPGYNLVGIGILLGSGLLWAIGSIYSHGADLPKSPLLGSGMELLAGGVGSLIVGLAMGEGHRLDISAISLRSLAGLGYLIVVGSLIGFVCYTWLLRAAPTQMVMTYAYVNPLVAVLAGSWLAQETMTTGVLIAIPLILSAVGLTQLRLPGKRIAERAMVVIGEGAGERS
jgi:drug/metabolite transporter (DMT)-like permease